jgi:hypothetical protein
MTTLAATDQALICISQLKADISILMNCWINNSLKTGVLKRIAIITLKACVGLVLTNYLSGETGILTETSLQAMSFLYVIALAQQEGPHAYRKLTTKIAPARFHDANCPYLALDATQMIE